MSDSTPQAESSDRLDRGLYLEEVQEVWAQAPHSAFTDLIRHGDAFVLAFREGRGHVSADGSLRILRSADGDSWDSVARISLDGFDLRDADLSVAPDGRLLLIGGACPRAGDGQRAPTGSIASWSSDARHWQPPHLVVDPGRWLWRVAWSQERAYGVSYSAGSGPARIDLMTSLDGESWTVRSDNIHPDQESNETALAFSPSQKGASPICVALARAQAGAQTACVGRADFPYTAFRWQPLGFSLGGPNLIRSPKGTWIAAGRIMQGASERTGVFFLDPITGKSDHLLLLPSGGDTSYPGLAFWKGDLFVSYYSSHALEVDSQGDPAPKKSKIYVARVRVEEGE